MRKQPARPAAHRCCQCGSSRLGRLRTDADKLRGMGQLASEAGRKLLALAVLLFAVWVVFKLVLGLVATIAWIAVAVIAVVAVVWAVHVL